MIWSRFLNCFVRGSDANDFLCFLLEVTFGIEPHLFVHDLVDQLEDIPTHKMRGRLVPLIKAKRSNKRFNSVCQNGLSRAASVFRLPSAKEEVLIHPQALGHTREGYGVDERGAIRGKA